LEGGGSSHGADEPVANLLIDINSFVKRGFDFDSAIDHACELVGNPGAFLISEELTQRDPTSTIPTEDPYTLAADAGTNWPIAESYQGYLVQFARMRGE
jgi:hypothetical protein